MTVTQQQGHVKMNASLVNEQDFHKLVEKRADMLLALVNYLSGCDNPRAVLTRPLLGEFLSQSMQFEELLDNYDAGKNCRWCTSPFPDGDDQAVLRRQLRADAHPAPAPSYRLMPVERDFAAATDEAMAFTSEILALACKGDARTRPASGT